MLKTKMETFGLNTDRIDDLLAFKEMVLRTNETMNLTAITDSDEVDVKHFLDSLSLFRTGYLRPGTTLLDVGTGAGFPGMALKIYEPQLRITLMDSLNKRIRFLNEVIDTLHLTDIKAVHGRAEECAKQNMRETFDVVTSRAVANMRTLLEYDLPFVKVGGVLIAMKGPEAEDELNASQKALTTLGGKVLEILSVELPEDLHHTLVIIKKIAPTPDKYPRAGGKPRSNPL
ncbi:16S rRNA (guanine(527)-N(7))-methyltransferase RsmG [Peptoniphilus equinus]|uniref:Ribosomal RNA small subunit methyltransferase G n=1 Tax=Peptoniphilus equinus TaxID=3016343 RepID=A0ABY7QU45_9FIRM|nr:16S rRNA (guanine(527)-N(7))-methyltransferase RsmG [Peptoniphilus equinus]WBW49976.1 16S rRNA (guanine(527)-N(7))-methyltransferase RsmG [Peptoniphilus equinus]